jgi:hypothetical protein
LHAVKPKKTWFRTQVPQKFAGADTQSLYVRA